MKQYLWFDRFIGIFGIAVLILGIIVTITMAYWMSKKTKCVIFSLFAMTAVFLIISSYPIGAEEHTNVVTIHGVSENVWAKNEAYFTVDGEQYKLKDEEGQELMYKLIEGHEVKLSYGKLHTLMFNKDQYVLTDIQLVNEDGVSQETLAAIMSLLND
jgi:hypothetical protein